MKKVLVVLCALLATPFAFAETCPIREFGDSTPVVLPVGPGADDLGAQYPELTAVANKYTPSLGRVARLTGMFQTACYHPEQRPFTEDEFRNGFFEQTADQHVPCLMIHFAGAREKFDRLVRQCGSYMTLDGVVFSFIYTGNAVQ